MISMAKKEKCDRSSMAGIAGIIVFGILCSIVVLGMTSKSSMEVECTFTDIEWVEHNESGSVDCFFSNADDKCPLPNGAHCRIEATGNAIGMTKLISALDD